MILDNVMDVFCDVLKRLEGGHIPYMVVGSVGSIIYGEPRMTNDLDIVAAVLPQDAAKIEGMFPLEGFYCPPIEVLRAEIVSRGQFNLIHHETGLKIDVIVRKDSPYAIEEFGRRRRLSFWEGFEANIASPEDVIIKKLDYYREGRSEKHISDIRGILANTEVDRTYLDQWIGSLGLREFWQQVES